MDTQYTEALRYRLERVLGIPVLVGSWNTQLDGTHALLALTAVEQGETLTSYKLTYELAIIVPQQGEGDQILRLMRRYHDLLHRAFEPNGTLRDMPPFQSLQGFLANYEPPDFVYQIVGEVIWQ